MSYVLVGVSLAVAASALFVAGFPAIARGWGRGSLQKAMRTLLIGVAIAVGALFVAGFAVASFLNPESEPLMNVMRALLALALLLIAWALLRPVVVGWLRGMRRDITGEGEDEGPTER